MGFIRDLPKALISAFRATLEEIEGSDLLVHVVDASNPRLMQQIESVDAILLDLGFNNIPQIVVLNKADLVDKSALDAIMRQISLDKDTQCVAISAIQPNTLKPLVTKIGEVLGDPAILEMQFATGN